MSRKSKALKKVIKEKCTEKVKLCTPKFCACGCYDENFSDDDIVALKDVEITFENSNKAEHKDTVCICDEYIIAFEPV